MGNTPSNTGLDRGGAHGRRQLETGHERSRGQIDSRQTSWEVSYSRKSAGYGV